MNGKTHFLVSTNADVFTCGVKNVFKDQSYMSTSLISLAGPTLALRFLENVNCARCRKSLKFKEVERNLLLQSELTK